MVSVISPAGLQELLLAAGEAVEREEAKLNAMDSAIGDGDHGITMRIGFQAIKRAIEALPPDSLPEEIWTVSGNAFMGSTGGAIGIILGRAFIAAGVAMRGHTSLGMAEWKLCFQTMEQAVCRTGKAQPGDKTVLDAIHGVNEALATANEDTGSAELLSIAAKGAEEAAAASANMRCRKGRASRLGDRALGHPDPGSVSFSIITRAMADRTRDL